jgi:pyruvate dehydrogenase E1 component beta subunit
MNYVQCVNAALRAGVERTAGPLVVFGQNVAAGSRIGGLGQGLANGPNRFVFNTPNVENTQVGMGLGLMLRGVSSIFIMKQQDFLLLGLDHIVNTHNAVRRRPLTASFTILAIVVDSGYEGPQSCLNNLGDFCSMARVPGFVATNSRDIQAVFDAHLVAPGFRLLGVSQRLFREAVIEPPGPVTASAGGEMFAYGSGADATIVAFNFAFPQAMKLQGAIEEAGADASLFSVNAMLPSTWEPILADLRRTRKLVVVDDSKSVNRASDRLVVEAARICPADSIVALTRSFAEDSYAPNPDTMHVDPAPVLATLGIGTIAPRRERMGGGRPR